MKNRILRQIEQRSMMLAGVSHDLKSPLTRIRLQTETIKDNAIKESLNDEVKHMNAMLSEYLEFYSIEQNTTLESINPIDAINKIKTKNITLLPIGKKAYDLFKKSDYSLILDYWQSLNGFDYEKSSEICDYIVSSFLNSKYDKVSIIYNEFKNVAVQKSVVDNFLPVIPLEKEISEVNNNYIFEPNKNKIVNNLIPQTLKTQFLKAVLESNASEQGSRMTAMSQATDNAGELLKELKLTYNRTRQAAITKEILEIVGGAEALNN